MISWSRSLEPAKTTTVPSPPRPTSARVCTEAATVVALAKGDRVQLFWEMSKEVWRSMTGASMPSAVPSTKEAILAS